MVCSLVYKFQSMRTYTNGFVVSLAVSDILAGGLLFPLKIANAYPSIVEYLISAVLISGVGNLCGVTVDRYIAVTRPLRYSYFTSKWFSKILVACWLVPLTISLLPLFWQGPENARVYSIYTVCLVIFGIILPYCAIFAAYFRIFRKIKNHNRHLSSVLTSRRFQRRTLSMEAKVSKVFAIVATTFVFSWLPVIYMTLAYEVSPTLIPDSMYTVSIFTIAVDSLANPVLYAFMKPDFKATLSRVVRNRRKPARAPRTMSLQVSLRENRKIPETVNFHSSCRSVQSNPTMTRSNSLRRSLKREDPAKNGSMAARRHRSRAVTISDSQSYNDEQSPTFHFSYLSSEDGEIPGKADTSHGDTILVKAGEGVSTYPSRGTEETIRTEDIHLASNLEKLNFPNVTKHREQKTKNIFHKTAQAVRASTYETRV